VRVGHATRPQVLDANQPRDRFYVGGDRIAAFRASGRVPGNVPEDWVASTTTLFGQTSAGLSCLPNGQLLVDAVRADPEEWLGPDHVREFGDDTCLLVKLLDAGQRLPVHAHPDRAFAMKHLGLVHGKTEAWVFLESAAVHLAFRREVREEELAQWVNQQDATAMLDAMHTLRVQRGDAVLIPAGMPHAIGEGAFLVELQEPTDLSILMEWSGFDIDGAELGHLGLGFETALRAVDRRSWSLESLELLRGSDAGHEGPLLPTAAGFFRVYRTRGSSECQAGYAVLIVVNGEGDLETADDEALRVRAGQTIVVPHAAGPYRLAGDAQLEVLHCRPPMHDHAQVGPGPDTTSPPL
jgi:mannose-6-phosphate isomerase